MKTPNLINLAIILCALSIGLAVFSQTGKAASGLGIMASTTFFCLFLKHLKD